MTSTFQVIFCDQELMAPYELLCYTGNHWIHFFVAVFNFFFIGILFPYQVYLIINKYQPVPHTFDENGNLIDLQVDEEKYLTQYRLFLDRDKCPYNFLYSGFEYGWSSYKVISMVIKMLLVFPIMIHFDSEFVAISINLAIVLSYALISGITRPFILPQDDYLDLCARVTAVLTLIIQICLYADVLDDSLGGTFFKHPSYNKFNSNGFDSSNPYR